MVLSSLQNLIEGRDCLELVMDGKNFNSQIFDFGNFKGHFMVNVTVPRSVPSRLNTSYQHLPDCSKRRYTVITGDADNFSSSGFQLRQTTGWTRPDSDWCADVFGGPTGGMTWSRNNGPSKNWVQHTADFLGSGDNLDLLVMYHNKPNGVKQVITEAKKPAIPKDKPKDDEYVEAKTLADIIMMSTTVFDYLRTLSDKWTKPGQNIEMISGELDLQYTRQYNTQNKPKGKALKKPDTPRGVKNWGLRTLWAYWIDNHLAKVEQIQSTWHKTAKTSMSAIKDPNDRTKVDEVAKKFADNTMMTGDAKVDNFKFPTPNPGKPLPGSPTSEFNDQSKYGMWGDNSLGKLGL